MATTYIAELDPAKIEKMQILVTNCKMSRDDILAKYGSKKVYLMNGGLYGGAYKPNCQLKVDGKVLGNDGYNYWGYSWNTALDFAMRKVPLDSNGYSNYISCAALLKDGVLCTLYNNDAHVDAPNRRTVIGKKNGNIMMMVTTNLYTPKQLQAYCKSLVWTDAIMLDGGGSSQCYFNGQVIVSSDKYLASTGFKERKVQNWIIIIMKDVSSPTDPTTPVIPDTPTTVYPVPPTRTLKLGSKGTDVSWVQTRLTVHGFTCPVTGDFYTTTETLVKKFQTAKGLESDGVVGSLTVKALKEEPTGTTTPTTPSKNPYTIPTRTLKYNDEGDDVKWLQQQLTLAGYTCQITGQFGPTTKSLVIKFQNDNKLDPDGVVGPDTRKALIAAVK